jgi:hypothetical protein
VDRARADNDKDSVIVASQYARGMETSSGNSALGLWSRANLMAKEGRLDERVILGTCNESKKCVEGSTITPMTLRSEIYFCILRSSSILGRGVCGSARGVSMPTSMLKDSKRGERVKRDGPR